MFKNQIHVNNIYHFWYCLQIMSLKLPVGSKTKVTTLNEPFPLCKYRSDTTVILKIKKANILHLFHT